MKHIGSNQGILRIKQSKRSISRSNEALEAIEQKSVRSIIEFFDWVNIQS